MSFSKVKNKKNTKGPGMRSKLVLGFSAINALLIISCLISVLEYRKMDSYVSDLIARDTECINRLMNMGDDTNRYNQEILMVIGVEELTQQPNFDADGFIAVCNSLSQAISTPEFISMVGSIKDSFKAFYEISMELPQVIKSPFIDSRSWYFERLQPYYFDLRASISNLEQAVHEDLTRNSSDYDSGFYRSIIPGIVAIGMSLILSLLLLFFILADYVHPVYLMQRALDGYITFGKQYGCKLEGKDQMDALNDGISSLVDENIQLKHRIIQIKRDNERKDNQ